jgi:four helix bundle suffix protein
VKKLRQSGGYRMLASFQTTTIIYDATVWFCERFLDPKSRTIDQMVQAARSGRQNIAEGSRASATSTESELKLINVARSSLEELLLDFEDFLRHRRLQLWDRDCDEARQVRHRAIGRAEMIKLSDDQRWDLYAAWLEHDNPEIRANAIICLIHQANYLLDQQVARLEQDFIENGGYREQLSAARFEHRTQQSHADSPKCPNCSGIMSIKTARSGRNAGSQFWGCDQFPTCRGVVPIDDR